MRRPQPFRRESVRVAALVERLRERVGVSIEPVEAGAPLEDRKITVRHVHRPTASGEKRAAYPCPRPA